jgi:hypothetical protein
MPLSVFAGWLLMLPFSPEREYRIQQHPAMRGCLLADADALAEQFPPATSSARLKRFR